MHIYLYLLENTHRQHASEMADSFRNASARCPPLRQARGTVLNTIMEDTRESQFAEKPNGGGSGNNNNNLSVPSAPLKLKTTDLPSARLSRLRSPLSAGSNSTCSDTEWKNQMAGFDDLYDTTDEETEFSDDCMSPTSTRPTSLTTPTTRNSMNSTPRNRYPSLKIPPASSIWASINNAPKSSPVPPTPPPKIPVSPAALSMLSEVVPASHAPPSLDGSVSSSDLVSNISAPATPDLQSLPDNDWGGQGIRVQLDLEDNQSSISDPHADSDTRNIEIPIENTDEDWNHVLSNFPRIPTARDELSGPEPVREQTPSDRGIVLPDGAMAMLEHIPLDGTPDPWSETSERNEEMWQLGAEINQPRSAENSTPESDISGYSFSRLSIPSPGGFFASLGPRARYTWSIPNANKVPSSATAEGFYNLPWRRNDDAVVEQVIDCPDRSTDEELTARIDDGPPTAVRIPSETPRPVEHTSPQSVTGGVTETPRSAVSYEYDESYAEDLRQRADASRDQTSVWLAAQASYLAALNETNPANTIDESTQIDAKEQEPSGTSSDSTRKKCVRFTGGMPEQASPGPSALASRDSIYWRGFQSVLRHSGRRDGFLYRDARFDAIQSARLGLSGIHTARLMGNYELVRHERPAYKGPFTQAPRNSVIASVLAEQAKFSKVEKEQLVLAQIQQPIWAINALRYLNGGHLIMNPASRRLCKTAGTGQRQGKKSSLRILDLGGQASCEWAWYLAHDYPNAKIYTAFTKEQAINHGIKGPSNHRRIAVPHLWKLPFPDNRFDVISARSLHALLKTESPIGEMKDEYDLCLKECYRCLKPGGYIEFFLMDAEISRAGTLASTASVEFAVKLKTRGYDSTPTKNFVSRLQKGNFVGVKRAWIFLPMGVVPVQTEAMRETPDPRMKSQIEGCEAVHGPVGSTADVANLTGLLGGWLWEQWLLKFQMETGRERERLLEGIGSVFDEGRKSGAGWTCLSGWATKPRSRRA